mmetsp:Transcript_127852/g.409479  ORF Transcript_127852/g.409479 Transcript_127852/m.409479 type:complete len:83 (-) Transcript_127852:44-292(-)
MACFARIHLRRQSVHPDLVAKFRTSYSCDVQPTSAVLLLLASLDCMSLQSENLQSHKVGELLREAKEHKGVACTQTHVLATF